MISHNRGVRKGKSSVGQQFVRVVFSVSEPKPRGCPAGSSRGRSTLMLVIDLAVSSNMVSQSIIYLLFRKTNMSCTLSPPFKCIPLFSMGMCYPSRQSFRRSRWAHVSATTFQPQTEQLVLQSKRNYKSLELLRDVL